MLGAIPIDLGERPLAGCLDVKATNMYPIVALGLRAPNPKCPLIQLPLPTHPALFFVIKNQRLGFLGPTLNCPLGGGGYLTGAVWTDVDGPGSCE